MLVLGLHPLQDPAAPRRGGGPRPERGGSGVVVTEQLLLSLQIARVAAGRVRPGGTLIFMAGTGARHPGPDVAIAAGLAVEIAPVRVNFIEAGFVGDAASLAVGLMVNTAITGATYSRG